MKTITDIIYPALALFTFVWFALAPQALATCQEGCDLIRENTFLGDGALINNTFGSLNTATGISALANNSDGSRNTANGAYALESNSYGGDNTAAGAFA